MGWLVEAIFNWLAVGAVDKAARKEPPWLFAAILTLPLALLIGLVWLLAR